MFTPYYRAYIFVSCGFSKADIHTRMKSVICYFSLFVLLLYIFIMCFASYLSVKIALHEDTRGFMCLVRCLFLLAVCRLSLMAAGFCISDLVTLYIWKYLVFRCVFNKRPFYRTYHDLKHPTKTNISAVREPRMRMRRKKKLNKLRWGVVHWLLTFVFVCFFIAYRWTRPF